ncbi:hypothetical protein [Candidatus Symbiobacter mobilis]|uniref:Uncharacterized protein n=1 Tax=Candidatus Symbiobacter mobilis CR TaxID=946483 RepID=U5NBT9_9BURK|nr:hypothetical protein [Candidatus Symbiobacter mobilis]AGX87649.1 hypothetical protein Cenrod_1564 [Candidatus Symbiobacter mobilis CR]
MTIPAIPLQEITNQALHILAKEMGAANTMRFLGQFSTGTGNYTEEREYLFGQLTLDDVLAEIGEKSGKTQA